MLRKLRFKFVCINMFIVTVMLCVIFALMITTTRNNLQEQSIQAMMQIVNNPGQMIRPDRDADKLTRTPYFVIYISSSGELLSVSGNQFDLTDDMVLVELLSEVLSRSQPQGLLPQYALRYCRVHTPIGEKIVFIDTSAQTETMEALVRNCIMIGALSFCVFLVLSILLAHWAVRPVERSWQQQRQFTADASHELKTPLTVIMTNAELLQSPDFTEEERAGFIQSISTMTHQMRGLVEQLLTLARIDNGAAQQEMARLSYSELITDAIMPFEALFYEKGLNVICNVQDGLYVSGNASSLTQAADIFLDNAQKYAYANTPVILTLQRCDRRHCQFSVTTTGECISEEDLTNIFKRFYRLDRARSRDGSYGLGLAIAAQIVQTHHGKIWAESKNGVNTFFIQLPLCA